jgi:hypothetical protein
VGANESRISALLRLPRRATLMQRAHWQGLLFLVILTLLICAAVASVGAAK